MPIWRNILIPSLRAFANVCLVLLSVAAVVLLGAAPALATSSEQRFRTREAARLRSSLEQSIPSQSVQDSLEYFGPGPCVGAKCPDKFPAPGTNIDRGHRDAAINVFAGGDITVTGDVAEMEGRIVTLGTFRVNKSPVGNYNIGVAGVGSRVSPPDGSDYLTVGGNLDVASGSTLIAERGYIRLGGQRIGNGHTRGGGVITDAGATQMYADAQSTLRSTSDTYAALPTTGTVSVSSWRATFRGDGESPVQVFQSNQSLESPDGGSLEFAFQGIPADATVIINLMGSNVRLATYSGDLNDSGTWNKLRDRMLWNFPNATSVTFHGPAQFQGSALIGQAGSTATVSVAGFSGRFFTAGSLTHTPDRLGGQGGEFHAYPFIPQAEDPENPDPENPDPENPDPDPENPDPKNPDPENPDPENPDPENPDPENPDPENPDPENPDPENPDPENPDPENPDPENPDPENPDPENPDPENPDPENPDPENPDPENPDPENPDPENPEPDVPEGTVTSPPPTTTSPPAPERPESETPRTPAVPLAPEQPKASAAQGARLATSGFSTREILPPLGASILLGAWLLVQGHVHSARDSEIVRSS
ncbi:choice-of-anchor A family protein [Leucobacter insecticola]|uniref:Choice-of-anchor A family protein n=1 Tax=Leucobacter insecticola TaxID=2714934 RepID=A0A6G8FJG9_9MICO|nr:choice-of-anchor A family protein [Leucobacter insecticola]QIM16504.1 choice-of-anchor A family protein [Leucobacter insecticola]